MSTEGCHEAVQSNTNEIIMKSIKITLVANNDYIIRYYNTIYFNIYIRLIFKIYTRSNFDFDSSKKKKLAKKGPVKKSLCILLKCI